MSQEDSEFIVLGDNSSVGAIVGSAVPGSGQKVGRLGHGFRSQNQYYCGPFVHVQLGEEHQAAVA